MKKAFVVLLAMVCGVQVFAQGLLQSTQEWATLIEQSCAAMQSGNWRQAENRLNQLIGFYDNERQKSINSRPDPYTGITIDMYVPLNHVSAWVDMALVQCNLGSRQGAVRAMENAVYLIRNSHEISANNSHEMAEDFLQKLRNPSFDFTFTYSELSQLSTMIMAAPTANFNQNHAKLMRRLDAIIGYCDSRTKTYQAEQDRMARQAKQTADYEYHQKTGRDFDPIRPPAGEKARIEWEYTRKIHQIFK